MSHSIYQTKPTKLNHPNQAFQTDFTKPNKTSEPNNRLLFDEFDIEFQDVNAWVHLSFFQCLTLHVVPTWWLNYLRRQFVYNLFYHLQRFKHCWCTCTSTAAQIRERKEREAAAKERERGAELEQVDDHDYGDHVHHYQNMKYFKRSNEPDKW